jgi:hypothetical protein
MRFDTPQEQIIDRWTRANRKQWAKMVEKAHWLNDDHYRQPEFFFWSDLPEDLKAELTKPPGPAMLEKPLRRWYKPDRAFTQAAVNYLKIKALTGRVASRYLAASRQG